MNRVELDALTDKFAPPIVVVTYHGNLKLVAPPQLEAYTMNCEVALKQAEAHQAMVLPKKECLFAVSERHWEAVKPSIRRRHRVARRKHKAKTQMWKRPVVQKVPLYRELKVCLRNGLVLAGSFVAMDKYTMLMRTTPSGKKVLIWKHAVQEIKKVRPLPSLDKYHRLR